MSHPLFLIALIAVAIPIVIHLFNFRRYHKVYFSNVGKLTQLQEETRRASKLRQRLLLACRIAAIVFLVLAMCDPVIGGSDQPKGEAWVSVYIDNSYSMNSLNADGPLLETAIRKGQEIASAYGAADHFQLITSELLGTQFHWLSKEEYLAALQEVTICTSTATIEQVALRQQQFLDHCASTARREAYIVTDAQRSTTHPDALPADTLTKTTIIPIEATEMSNLFIDTVVFSAPTYYPNSTIGLTATLHNEGDQDIENATVRLYADGKEQAIATANVAAHATATAALSFKAARQQTMHCYVEATDYPLTFDDRLYFSINLSQQRKVCLIGSDNKNIRQIFAPEQEHDSLLSFHYCTTRNADLTGLDRFDLVILNEPQELSEGLSQALVAYAKQGGTLAIIPPAETLPATLATMLAQCHAATLGQWCRQKTQCSQIVATSALYQGVFEGSASPTDELPTLNAYYTTATTSHTICEPVITIGYNHSSLYYLSRTPVEQGQLYLFATPLAEAYTDFVHQAMVVPTLLNMALLDAAMPTPYYTTCADARITLPAGIATPILTAEYPAMQEPWQLSPDLGRQGANSIAHIASQSLPQAGNYLLRNQEADAKSPQVGISFNYSRHESYMSFYSPSELKKELSGRANYDVVSSPQHSLTEYIQSRDGGHHLWRYMLIAALLAMAAETLLIRKSLRQAPNTQA